MKKLLSTIVVLVATLATSGIISAQIREGALLRVEASSTVLFSENDADKGAENPMGVFSVIAGYKLSDHISAGLGFGFDAEMKSDSKSVTKGGTIHENTTSTISTPLFIYLRGDILPDSKVCPFVAGELGYKATLSRANDEQKGEFYEYLKANATDMVYSRYYCAGAFGELTAGLAFELGQGHKLDIGISYVNYTRKNTVMKAGSDKYPTYNTTSEGKNGVSFKIGINF